ncbi:hypothetical protein [Billgrantia kenyensis]|uniref:Uncharacterized protein n=1 Tax=Billgrantia kenyensis TaxID=321266 RepID=A0A7W0AET9_9GAMM|nr:hypothetical protein [Halomonas kenyensis]MBA2779934.1 hypothetical protein [Halomonas kenyensis]MCG6662068.1 hypothetical protein [Halomonas kenyensis]
MSVGPNRVLAAWLTLLIGFSALAGADTHPSQAPCQQAVAEGLPTSGCNRALTLHVTSIDFAEELNGRTPPPGRRWLTLGVRFENWMPSDLVFGLGYQEALLVASIERQLYLRVDDRLVVRPTLVKDTGLEGQFVLSRAGAQRHGEIAFVVPEKSLSQLSLHYYHDQYGPLAVPLLGEITQPQALRQAARSVDGHDLLALGVHEVGLHQEWLGRRAAEGMQWLVVDLRGQGEWHTPVDARALDVAAELDEKGSLRRVMEYIEAPGLLQVVVDGRHAYVRDSRLSSLEDDPALLPDAWTGGRAVFAIPEDAGQIDLVAYMPQFRATEISTEIRPALRFSLQEGKSIPVDDEPVAVIEDDPIRVTFHSLEPVDAFAAHAEEQGQLVLIEASMSNLSGVGGMMAVADRFRLQEPGGELVGVFQRGPAPLEEPFWLPADDEPRHFTLLYRLQAPSDELEIEYGGVSATESLALRVPH